MARSPLSGAFAKTSGTTKQKTSKNGAILLISGIALATSIGGVFAANNSISINSGEGIEFAQGAAETTQCDTGGMETVVSQSYDTQAAASEDVFRVSEVVVRNISSDCNGADLRLSLLNSSDAELTATTLRLGFESAMTWDVSPAAIDAGDVVRVAITTEGIVSNGG